MGYSKIIVAGLWSCMTITYAQSTMETATEATDGIIMVNMDERKMAMTATDAQAIASYWTSAKMAKAKPMQMPKVVIKSDSLLFPLTTQESDEQALPGYSPGCPPKAKNCDTAPRTVSSESLLSSESVAHGDLIQPMHGTKPVNPKNGPYGPFQRWREAEPITAYPKSTIGILFYTLNGRDASCSASVINRSTLITAGHCSSDGKGHLATNQLFCPSYANGANPARGCWAVIGRVVSGRWHTLGDADYDYSCLVTATTGTKIADKIGNVTGWLAHAWNFPPSQAERTFGYPGVSPFTGGTLQTTASAEWYTYDSTSGRQLSKIIGSDLTGGSSGGPWILGWTGGLGETPDTDASSATDPLNNAVNGVNSHSRCLVNCNTPPTTTSGLFWQEMSSPPFRNTTSDNEESEDIIAACFAHSNNNP
jgi:V8-like Glu-specific endopeptidase